MTSRRPGRPTNAERPDRISDITQASIELFGARGYAEVSFASIARSAGMTPAALYHYFDDKAGLYLNAVGSARDTLWSAISERFEPTGSFPDDFEALCDLLISLRTPIMSPVKRILAAAHVTAAHHPELAPLLADRWRVRDEIVGDIGRNAFATGQIAGFADAEDAALAVEVVFSGLANEMYVNASMVPHLVGAATRLMRGLAQNTDLIPTAERKPE